VSYHRLNTHQVLQPNDRRFASLYTKKSTLKFSHFTVWRTQKTTTAIKWHYFTFFTNNISLSLLRLTHRWPNFYTDKAYWKLETHCPSFLTVSAVLFAKTFVLTTKHKHADNFPTNIALPSAKIIIANIVCVKTNFQHLTNMTVILCSTKASTTRHMVQAKIQKLCIHQHII
jgi:hypothetical protein